MDNIEAPPSSIKNFRLTPKGKAVGDLARLLASGEKVDVEKFFKKTGFDKTTTFQIIEMAKDVAKLMIASAEAARAMRIALTPPYEQIDGLAMYLLEAFPEAIKARDPDTEGACEVALRQLERFRKNERLAKTVTEGLIAVLKAKNGGEFRICEKGLREAETKGEFIRVTKKPDGMALFQVLSKEEVEKKEKAGEVSHADSEGKPSEVS